MIFASARAHERAHVQNVRDFPQTKLDSEINYPFLLNEHGDHRLFFQVFAKNIEITSWKVRAYGIFTRVGEVSEIERVSAANE